MSFSTPTFLPFNYSYGGLGYTGYTHIGFQPDTLSLFVKKGNKLLIHHTEPVINLVAKWIPLLGSMAGVWRIINAVAIIFICPLDQSFSPLWNHLKNLGRGVVEALPGSGICLIIFDAVRNRCVISPKITQEVANQDNIVGFALDGVVLPTIDLASFERRKNFQSTSDAHSFIFFTRFALDYLRNCSANNTNSKMELRPIVEPFKVFREESLKGAAAT